MLAVSGALDTGSGNELDTAFRVETADFHRTTVPVGRVLVVSSAYCVPPPIPTSSTAMVTRNVLLLNGCARIVLVLCEKVLTCASVACVARLDTVPMLAVTLPPARLLTPMLPTTVTLPATELTPISPTMVTLPATPLTVTGRGLVLATSPLDAPSMPWTNLMR